MTSAEYYSAHREEILQAAREYAARHREERRAYRRTYYAAHRQSALEYAKERRARLLAREPNLDAIEYAKHREHRAAYRAAHQSDNSRRFYQGHKPEHLDYNKRYNWRKHTAVIMLLGGKCVVCGLDDIRVLQINHINGHGGQEFRKLGTGFYRNILSGKRAREDLEVRCANHNILYEFEVGRRRVYV